MLEKFGQNKEIEYFIKRRQKVIYHTHCMIEMRNNNSVNFRDIVGYDKDLQLSLLENAIELVDTFTQKYPDKKNKLEQYQRRIREKLARYQ